MQVDTTTGLNGYPRDVRVAYTADTMAELRSMKENFERDGYDVTPVRLHRRDGWALWERFDDHDLDDDRWARPDPGAVYTTYLNPTSDAMEEAFNMVCGGLNINTADDLLRYADRVRQLADQLPDPSDLLDGEECVVTLSDDLTVAYYVRTGQNGYAYDTHNYCSALLIEKREEDEESED